MGVLALRDGAIGDDFYPNRDRSIPRIPPSHPAVIEWRAMTVILLYVPSLPCQILIRNRRSYSLCRPTADHEELLALRF